MNKNAVSGIAETFRAILPVILRITFCLAMWDSGRHDDGNHGGADTGASRGAGDFSAPRAC